MIPTKRRHSKEAIAKAGDQIYESLVRPKLKQRDRGKFAAIDIESRDFEIASDEISACDRLRARQPDAQIWLMRIGSRVVRRFGGRNLRSRL